MPIVDAQLGFGEETTPGTAVVVNRFAELVEEAVKRSEERIESQSLRVGRRTQDRWAKGRTGAEGPVTLEVMPAGFGLIAKHMLGVIATTTPDAIGAPDVRLHIAKVGAIDGKALTMQFGRKGTGAATVHPFTYRGTKITEWELSNTVDELLQVQLTTDSWDETTATALATASYSTTAEPLPFVGATIEIDNVVYDVANFSLSASNALKKDRFHLGSKVKREQVEGDGLREYTGTLELESFKNLTPYNLFVNGTEAQLEGEWAGEIAQGALKYLVKVTMPRVRFDGETPNISGPELIGQSLPYKALYSSAASTEVQIEVQNKDLTP